MKSESMSKRQRAQGVLSMVGHTPLVPLYFEREGRTIYAKCEFLNPSGSVKDRPRLCVMSVECPLRQGPSGMRTLQRARRRPRRSEA